MKPDFIALLRALTEARVEYVVVDGVAAIIEGAPVTTLDLDAVYRVDDENLHRLLELLTTLDASYRDPAGRDLRPTLAGLRDNRVNLLDTRLGPLDLMQRIGTGWGFDELLDRVHTRRVADLEVRVLDLAAVIESKQAAGRDTDKAMLPVLLRTLEAKRSGS